MRKLGLLWWIDWRRSDHKTGRWVKEDDGLGWKEEDVRMITGGYKCGEERTRKKSTSDEYYTFSGIGWRLGIRYVF